MNTNIFEYAAENKIRFAYNGRISTEDLFDLSLIQLDSIYKALKREQKKESEESLLSEISAEDELTKVKIEIVKYIVEKKLEQEKAAKTAAEKARKKQRLAEILYQKQDEELKNKSAAEIQAMIDELE